MSLSLNDWQFYKFHPKFVALLTEKPVLAEIGLGKNELGVFTRRHQNSILETIDRDSSEFLLS